MSGSSPLKIDVRNVPVPDKWAKACCQFEYRHGYGKGLEKDGVACPISHIGEDSGARRGAWFAGYKAGCTERQATIKQPGGPELDAEMARDDEVDVEDGGDVIIRKTRGQGKTTAGDFSP